MRERGREDAQARPRVRKPGHRRRPFFGARDAGRILMRMYRLWRLLAAALLLSRTVSAATLNGRVTAPDGRPVADARIVVVGALGAVADRETSADGSFELGALPARRTGIESAHEGRRVEAL